MPHYTMPHYPYPIQCVVIWQDKLASWIREERGIGIPVHLWMVREQALLLHKTIHPSLWLDDNITFKCSNGWLNNFMRRQKFSIRVVSRRKQNFRSKEEVIETIRKFHIEARLTQLEVRGHDIYGLTGPECVFNRDQVPIELCNSRCRTVDETGVSQVLVVMLV